jgi:hypothetical protein
VSHKSRTTGNNGVLIQLLRNLFYMSPVSEFLAGCDLHIAELIPHARLFSVSSLATATKGRRILLMFQDLWDTLYKNLLLHHCCSQLYEKKNNKKKQINVPNLLKCLTTARKTITSKNKRSNKNVTKTHNISIRENIRARTKYNKN